METVIIEEKKPLKETKPKLKSLKEKPKKKKESEGITITHKSVILYF